MSVLALMAQESGGQVEQIARTFGVDWPHLTAQIISFAIVCALLYWLAYQPVLRMLDDAAPADRAGAGEHREDQRRARRHRGAAAGRDGRGAGAVDAAHRRGPRRSPRACSEQETQRAVAAAEQIVRQAREAAAQEHARMLGRAPARSRPAGGADDGRRHRQGADAGRSAPAGRRNGQAADDRRETAGTRRMKTAETGAA